MVAEGIVLKLIVHQINTVNFSLTTHYIVLAAFILCGIGCLPPKHNESTLLKSEPAAQKKMGLKDKSFKLIRIIFIRLQKESNSLSGQLHPIATVLKNYT